MSDRPRESASYSDPISLVLKLTGLAILAVGAALSGFVLLFVIPHIGLVFDGMELDYGGIGWVFGVGKGTLALVWAGMAAVPLVVIVWVWKRRQGGIVALGAGLFEIVAAFLCLFLVIFTVWGISVQLVGLPAHP